MVKHHDEYPYCHYDHAITNLERTGIADHFIYCVNHGSLAKLAEYWNNNDRIESDEMSSVSCINCNNKDEVLSAFGTFVCT